MKVKAIDKLERDESYLLQLQAAETTLTPVLGGQVAGLFRRKPFLAIELAREIEGKTPTDPLVISLREVGIRAATLFKASRSSDESEVLNRMAQRVLVGAAHELSSKGVDATLGKLHNTFSDVQALRSAALKVKGTRITEALHQAGERLSRGASEPYYAIAAASHAAIQDTHSFLSHSKTGLLLTVEPGSEARVDLGGEELATHGLVEGGHVTPTQSASGANSFRVSGATVLLPQGAHFQIGENKWRVNAASRKAVELEGVEGPVNNRRFSFRNHPVRIGSASTSHMRLME